MEKMDGGTEQQLICRACLRVVENKSASFGYIEDSYGNLKDMLMCCMPEMDIYVSTQPVMCFPCIQLLITVYNFKTRCLNTETIIRSYIQRNNLMEYNHVNLNCVVQEQNRLNYFRDMNKIKTEAPHVNSALLDSCNMPNSQIEATIPSKEGENVVENCTENNPEALNRVEINTELPQIIEEPVANVEQNNLVESRIDNENSNFQSDLPEDRIEEGTYLSQEAQDALQCGLPGKEIVQRQFLPPHVMNRQNFPQRNLTINYMGERGFLFHPTNMHQGLLQNQMAERILALPQLHMQPRIGPYSVPYNLPLRGQMPERFFPIPPMNMDQRFPQYVIPGGHMNYALPPVNMEQRIPSYGVSANHVDERIYLHPLTSVEEKVTRPLNGVVESQCALSQANKGNEYVVAQKEEEELSSPSKNSKEEEETGTNTKESGEENVGSSIGNGKVIEEQPAQNKLRIILRIDKRRIINSTEPYDKNEDYSEKENEQEDVEMKENGMPPPANGEFLYPDEHNQELYQCSNCTFVTTNLNYHISHKKICLNELEKNEKKCPHCPHVTNRQYALNKHINTMHTKAIWYTCDFCNYRSTDSSCLRRHKRNVHPEKVGNELTCHQCAYRCMTEYHLRKHLLKHDENTTLQCQFCSYSTRDRSNFRKHIFIHNPKPKECEFCDYKCVSPYQMKVHLKKYHHGVGLEDIDCRSDVSLSEVVDDISNAIKESKNYIGHMAE